MVNLELTMLVEGKMMVRCEKSPISFIRDSLSWVKRDPYCIHYILTVSQSSLGGCTVLNFELLPSAKDHSIRVMVVVQAGSLTWMVPTINRMNHLSTNGCLAIQVDGFYFCNILESSSDCLSDFRAHGVSDQLTLLMGSTGM